MKELSLRPYFGTVRVCKTVKQFQKQHEKLFGEPDVLGRDGHERKGRFVGKLGDHDPIFLVWAVDNARLAHELSHAILEVFQMAGIDPREAGGEPFCYMLTQLLIEANWK